MSDQTQTEDEPSIEEILDSIRQIISEDEDEDNVEDAVAEPVEEAAPEPVLDPEEPLDQSAIDDIDFDAPPAEPEPAAAPEEPLDQSAIDDIDFDSPAEPEAEEDILDLTDMVEDEPAPEPPKPDPEPEPVIEEPAPEPIAEEKASPEAIIESPTQVESPVPSEDDGDLLTKSAENAAVSAITELVRKTAVEHSGVTLEDIVRAELKPLLRDWLDKNLPIVIERLVQEELERVSKRVLED